MPTFTDEHGVVVTYHEWPVERPRGVVQLLHGIGEYARRYEHVAAALNRAGFAVYADDHRGHGQTGLDQWHGDVSRLGRLGPGGHRAAVADVHRLTGIIRDERPGVPLVLLGHSWGSLIAQILLNRHPRDYDAAVLSGTALRMPGSMNGGDLAKRHRVPGGTGHEWLSRDPAVAEAFAADPLTFDAKVLELFGVADGLRLYGRPRPGLDPRMPLLIQVGEDDTLGGPRSAQRLADAYRRRAGLQDVTVIVYPGARHEVYNETNKEEVIADLTGWLTARFPAP